MEPLTLFDVIANDTFWQTTYCNWCEGRLPSKDQLFNEEMVIRSFTGSAGQLILKGYHHECYAQYSNNEKTLAEILDEGE